MHRILGALIGRTRALPTPLRYAGTAAIVLATLLLRRALDPVLPDRYPYLLSMPAILLGAALFDRGCGLLATALAAAFAAYYYLPPARSLAVEEVSDVVGLALFVGVGGALSLAVEALHRALAELQKAYADLGRSERGRGLLLREFRHRTRNDLGSLAGLLLLRARAAPPGAGRDGLREAAGHAMALARVHTRLAPDGVDGDAMAAVDTGAFVAGLCADLRAVLAGDGLRPVAIEADAEAHALDPERAVQLGLVLNETVTNALKYGFPEGRAGTVRVRFRREGDTFVLGVVDDGVGPPRDGDVGRAAASPRGTGLGTRLLQALAAQLRGCFSRGPGEGGTGTAAELRFPAATPGQPVRP